MQKFIGKLVNAYQSFKNVLFEGHYSGHEHIDHLLNNEHPACSAEEKAGRKAFGLAVFIGGDVALNIAYAFFSYSTMGIFTAISSIAGAVFYTHEYIRCRRLAREEIAEVNLAGQHVIGTRGDLCCLHRAQTKIIDLTIEYNSAASDGLRNILQDKIDETIAGVKNEVSRVRVQSGGRYYPGSLTYQFEQISRYDQHLSLDQRRQSQQKKPVEQKDLAPVPLRRAA